MIKQFPQIIPSGVCLKCHGCCRFREIESDWRPKVTKQEASVYEPGSLDGHFIRAKEHEDINLCMYLDEKENACQIYKKRPFECQFYPFLITQKNNKFVVSLHLSCPYVEDNRKSELFEDYIRFVREFFENPEIVEGFKENLHLAGDYSEFDEELEEIVEIRI